MIKPRDCIPLGFTGESVLILRNNKFIEKPVSVTSVVCCILVQKHVILFKGDAFILDQNLVVSFKSTAVPLFR